MEPLFSVGTPLGIEIRCQRAYWDLVILLKHEILKGREAEICQTLAQPEEIRRSRRDPDVYLFYRRHTDRWLCAVVRKQDGSGFLITAYPTNAIKAG
jgi:hypothetical protein